MMGIVMAETCWAYKKDNKIISGMKLVFILQIPGWICRVWSEVSRGIEWGNIFTSVYLITSRIIFFVDEPVCHYQYYYLLLSKYLFISNIDLQL